MCNAMLDENEMDRLPFGRTAFSSVRRDGNIYVDKNGNGKTSGEN